MIRRDIIELTQVLKSLMEERMSPSLAYAIASNFALAEAEATTISGIYKPVDGFNEYSEARNELIRTHNGTADENGMITIPKESAKSFQEAIVKLDGENSEIVMQQREYDSEFNQFLDEDSESGIEFIKINKEELPDIEPSKILTLIRTGLIE